MRHSFLLLTLFLAGGSVLPAQEPVMGGVAPISPSQATSRKIELLPSQKAPLIMRAEERNPYARRSPDTEEVEIFDEGESEEDRIRKIFDGLTVTGVSRGPAGLRALVGDMILQRGHFVPQMLPDQSEFLLVKSVAEDEIILSWIDADSGEPTGKELTIGFNLETKVRSILSGQIASEESRELQYFERKVDSERRRAAIAQNQAFDRQSETEAQADNSDEAKSGSTVLNGLDPEAYFKGQ